VDVKDLKLYDYDNDLEDFMITFTCGPVKSSQTYKNKAPFSMKVSQDKVN
jgi:hypothetical protein